VEWAETTSAPQLPEIVLLISVILKIVLTFLDIYVPFFAIFFGGIE